VTAYAHTWTPKTQKGFVDSLAGKVGDLVKSERRKMAEDLLQALVYGSPKQRYEAELVANALGLDVAKLRGRTESGEYETAVDRVMRKLASW
jgi:hypothetical protein